MAKEPKSTKTLGYGLKGILNLEDMTVKEILDEGEEVVHDLNEIMSQFDNKDITILISMKDKLGD